MSSFWNNLYDRHKDRRYATIFLVTIFAFFGLAVPAVILFLHLPAFHVPFAYLLSGMGLIAMAGVWWAVRWFRAPRSNPPKFLPLSRDERHKARSKLLKDQQFKKL